jgi:hypothetical protein
LERRAGHGFSPLDVLVLLRTTTTTTTAAA